MNCIICTHKIKDPYGHNPAPLFDNGRCCTDCNDLFVVPIRLLRAAKPLEVADENSQVGA
jgi:hypothetical protein